MSDEELHPELDRAPSIDSIREVNSVGSKYCDSEMMAANSVDCVTCEHIQWEPFHNKLEHKSVLNGIHHGSKTTFTLTGISPIYFRTDTNSV